MPHKRHARGCEVEVPPEHLMCAVHWRLVPLSLKRHVWAYYRLGQEVDKQPTAEYLAAALAAINAVAEIEGRTGH